MAPILGTLMKARTLIKAVTFDRGIRFPASLLGLATVVALLDSQTSDVPSAVITDAAQALGLDVSWVQPATAWLAHHPGITDAAYCLAALSAWVLVRKRPWIDIDQTGTVCVTRASATLVLSYALAVECGGGVHVAPTLIILAILGATAIYIAREDQRFISSREILGIVLCEVFFAVMYVPVLALCVLYPALFGPLSAYEQQQ
jgi:hypothetical protein